MSNTAIVLQNKRTSVESRSTSNESGLSLLPPLSPGDYQLTAEAPGFGVATVTGIRREVGASPVINVTLQLKQVSESVTVTASSPVLRTERADRGESRGKQLCRERALERTQSSATD